MPFLFCLYSCNETLVFGVGKCVPVCVFVGGDENGRMRFACMRGVNVDLRKGDYRSNKEYDFSRQQAPCGVRGSNICAFFHAALRDWEGSDTGTIFLLVVLLMWQWSHF